jgi:hypothetical protein
MKEARPRTRCSSRLQPLPDKRGFEEVDAGTDTGPEGSAQKSVSSLDPAYELLTDLGRLGRVAR